MGFEIDGEKENEKQKVCPFFDSMSFLTFLKLTLIFFTDSHIK